MEIQTVLCPVDLTPLSDRELELATEVCQAFDARLVLLHNMAGSAGHMAKPWEWDASHRKAGDLTKAQAEEKLQEVAAGLPDGVDWEACVTHGPVGLVLTQMAEKLPADLMLLASHGWSDDEHDSLTERLISDSPCPVLTIQEGRGADHHFRLRGEASKRPKILVPTDFSETASRAVDYGFRLAEKLEVEVHLLHVARNGDAAETARKKLEQMVPDDISDKLRCHVQTGQAAGEIIASARDLDAEMILMGEHARGLLRSLFTRDTAKELLHRAPCAVWFVPAKVEVAAPGS